MPQVFRGVDEEADQREATCQAKAVCEDLDCSHDNYAVAFDFRHFPDVVLAKVYGRDGTQEETADQGVETQ